MHWPLPCEKFGFSQPYSLSHLPQPAKPLAFVSADFSLAQAAALRKYFLPARWRLNQRPLRHWKPLAACTQALAQQPGRGLNGSFCQPLNSRLENPLCQNAPASRSPRLPKTCLSLTAPPRTTASSPTGFTSIGNVPYGSTRSLLNPPSRCLPNPPLSSHPPAGSFPRAV